MLLYKRRTKDGPSLISFYVGKSVLLGIIKEKKMRKNINRILGIFLSLLMILSVITIPSFKSKAAAGTVDDFVERCYTVTLGRGSDPEGFAYWKGQLLNGQAVGVHVACGFLFSPEYTQKQKGDSAYVRDLYMLFMGRDPDDSGYNYWMNLLDEGKSREEVFAGFANSPEFYEICDSYGITAGRWFIGYDRFQVNDVNLFVERLYKVCFGRRSDIGGQEHWVGQLIKKQITGSECARSFIQSTEYENLGLSDADYVENLYIALMGRASDAGGKANWLNCLANGMTRDEVFEGFVNSAEFDNICKQYNIDRGSYTAKNKGTYDPNKANNNQNNQNNNNQNNNQNSNVENNKKTAYRLKKQVVDQYNDGEFVNRYTSCFTYNSKGFLASEECVSDRWGFEYLLECEFDKNGYPVSLISKELYDEHLAKSFKYDSKGNMIEETVYDSNYPYLIEQITKYNSDGEITEEYYYINGEFSERVVYTLNSSGKRVSGCTYCTDENGVEQSYESATFKYDSSGNCIYRENKTNFGLHIDTYTMEYDSAGNCTYENAVKKRYPNTNSSGFTLKSNIHYEYEYDEHGNIIKKTKYAEDNNTWRICTTWISEYEEYIISER